MTLKKTNLNEIVTQTIGGIPVIIWKNSNPPMSHTDIDQKKFKEIFYLYVVIIDE